MNKMNENKRQVVDRILERENTKTKNSIVFVLNN